MPTQINFFGRMNERIHTRMQYAIAGAAGIISAAFEFYSTDPQKPIVVIIALTFALGFFFPERPWRWAIIFGCCFLLWNGIAWLAGAEPAYFQTIQQEYPQAKYDIYRVLETGFAVVPALLGVYGAAILHRWRKKKSR